MCGLTGFATTLTPVTGYTFNMRTYLKKQITRLQLLLPYPDDPHICEAEAVTIREAADKAAQAGHLDFYRKYRYTQAATPRDAIAILSSLLATISAEDASKNQPEYLTVDQVAARLQVSRDSIYDLINQGLLKHTKVGRIIRIRPADLDHIQTQDDGW